MYIDEVSASSLAKQINAFDATIIDTCSLMEIGFPAFLDKLSKAHSYLDSGKEIYVFKSCLKELKKHSKDLENNSKRIDAKRGIKLIKEAKKEGIVKFLKTRNKHFADNDMYVFLSQHRLEKSFLLITQDKSLSEDIKKLGQSLSQKGKPVIVFRITKDGELEKYSPDYPHKKFQKKGFKPLKEPRKVVKKEAIKSSISKIDETLIKEIRDMDLKLSATIPNPTANAELISKLCEAQIKNLKKLPKTQLVSFKLLVPMNTLKSKVIKEKKVEKKAASSHKKVAPKKGKTSVIETAKNKPQSKKISKKSSKIVGKK